MTSDQLDALRRQVEEDYRLDIAAIERLQRRFSIVLPGVPAASYSSSANGSNGESRATIPAPQATPAVSHHDELEGSLRSMFTSSRK